MATFLGTLLALSLPIGLAACATWAVIAALFRISSLAALVAAALSPLAASVLGAPQAMGLCIALAFLIGLRHHENINRLMKGTEPKIGKKG